MTKPAIRRVPMVFRFAGAVLLIAAIGGQVWQRQPAGQATRLILASVARYCPAADRGVADPSIADGAHALDRWGYRVIADAVAPQATSRCARKNGMKGNEG